jgi:hypothetical protein
LTEEKLSDHTSVDQVVVATFLNASEAHGAVAMLVSAGIDAQLHDEQTAGLNWLYTAAIGGVRLVVPSTEESAARELLNSLPPQVETLAPEDESYFAAQRSERRRRGLWALFLAVPWLAPLIALATRRSSDPTPTGKRGVG